jgi:hypothetical protein
MLRREQSNSDPEASLLMHRLVQDITRFRLEKESHVEWLHQALHLANSVSPGDPQYVRTWPK